MTQLTKQFFSPSEGLSCYLRRNLRSTISSSNLWQRHFPLLTPGSPWVSVRLRSEKHLPLTRFHELLMPTSKV